MAECIVLKGGGGVDLDVVTAGKPDVLAGKIIVDKEGEPLSGTMPNRGAVNQTLNAGGSYTIPTGYHNGSGKVTANSLASQTPGNADAGSILSGRSAWVNGAKVDGAIPWQNAEIAGTDRAWSQGMSNWAGTINLKVRNGHYLNGVNWIQQDIPNYRPENIKKNVNIGGVVGTWEGWVPTATDLYLRGNNIRGWTSPGGGGGGGVTFDTGQITLNLVGANRTGIIEANLNFTGYSRINIEGYTSNGTTTIKELRLWKMAENRLLGFLDVTGNNAGNYIYSFDISAYQVSGLMRLNFYQLTGAVYRIWLS